MLIRSDEVTIDTTKGIAGLKGALRYVRAYRDQVFVVKLGGDVLSDAGGARPGRGAARAAVTRSASASSWCTAAGRRRPALSRRLGAEPRMVAGRRVTDDAALEVAKMVYAGQLNTDLLAALRAHRVQAVGPERRGRRPDHRAPPPAGAGGGRRRHRRAKVDYGHVGDIDRVDPRVLADPAGGALRAGGREPGRRRATATCYNVNADTVAESLAVALRAQKLIFLTGAPGVLRDRSDPSTLVTFADPDDLAALHGQRGARRRDAAQGRGVHPRRHRRGRAHPHHRRPGARRAAARGVHRRRAAAP